MGEPRVSVVVPVYNAGGYLQRCVDALLAQTLSPPELELIFVDDGSTDDSLERLRALEAAHPHVRVLAIPNSGWPGRPRNVGTDAARGQYVMYVDQDDVVEPEALERMSAYGAENRADVVLGKVISDFRGVHHYLYRENRASCTIYTARLMGSQTPHKMLRTEFLRRHGIRFPEGRRRLEDQVFITKAYFAAESVSIVADYVCYRYLRRLDAGNAASHRVSPAAYYANLREVLDVVDSNTEPGELRNGFYRRFLKTEMLGRLGGRKLRTAPAQHRVELLHEVRTLMSERFGPAVVAGLPAALRVRAALAAAGDLDELVALDARMSSLALHATLERIEPTDGGSVALTVSAEFRWAGSSLRLERAGSDWMLPRALVGMHVSDEDRRLEPLSDTMGDVVIRHRELLDEWFVPGGLEPVVVGTSDGGSLRWRGTALLQPDTAAGGSPLRPGVHDLLTRIDAFGINRTVRLGAEREADGELSDLGERDKLMVIASARSLVYANRGGQLSLKSAVSRTQAAKVLAKGGGTAVDQGRLIIRLPAVWREHPRRLSVRLRPVDQAPLGDETSRVHVEPSPERRDTWLSSRTALASLHGTYQVEVSIPTVGKVMLAPIQLAPPAQTRNVLARGARTVAGYLPDPVVRRLRGSRTVQRLLRGKRSGS